MADESASFEDAAKQVTLSRATLLRDALNDLMIIVVRDGVLLGPEMTAQVMGASDLIRLAIRGCEERLRPCSCGFSPINELDLKVHLDELKCPRTEGTA